MVKGDFIWGFVLILSIGFVFFCNETFLYFTKNYPLISGFIKFGILATMGELLAIRIVSRSYQKPNMFIARVIIWGFLGVVITLMFNIFANGIKVIMDNGLILGRDNKYVFAIWVSVIMNLIFAPTFMAFHRYTDTYLDIFSTGKKEIKITDVTNSIDWDGFVSFVVVKTIPFFWIPAHFVTFLLPSSYRVLIAAFLSIALGAILAFGKRKK